MKKNISLVLLFIVVVAFSIVMIRPTFMSSDEGNHFARAYTLYQGKIFLDPPPDREEGYQTGTMIDVNLIRFIMNEGGASPGTRYLYYKEGWDKKIDPASPLVWGNTEAFKVLPGEAYYFPTIYLPQTLGIVIGKICNLSILNTYYISTFFVFLTTIGLLYLAYKVFPINPFVFSILVLPVQVVQMYSPVIDSVSSALSVLVLSIFMKIMSTEKNSKLPLWYFIAMSLSLFIIGTSRIHLAPMVLFLFIVGFSKKQPKYIVSSIIVSLLIIIWSYIAGKTTVDLRMNEDHSNFKVIGYFLMNPGQLFSIIFNTVTDLNYLSRYAEEFVVYRNYPLRSLYSPFLVMVFICGCLSVSTSNFKKDWGVRLILITTSLICIFLIFFFLLIAWSGTSFDRIVGVMGRYFAVPFIMIGYALSGCYWNINSKKVKYGYLMLVLLIFVSMGFLSYAHLSGKANKLYPNEIVSSMTFVETDVS